MHKTLPSIFASLCVLWVSFIICIASARGQTSVYGAVDIAQYGYSSTVAGDFNYSTTGSGYSEYGNTVGLEGGGIYMFHNAGRLKAGLDGRGIYSPGNKGGAAGFGSFRLAFVPHTHLLSPYAELGGGVISVPLHGPTVTTTANGTVTSVQYIPRVNGGAADFLLGLDIRTHSPWAIRALEFGGYAGSKTTLTTIGFGVIYNFQDRKHP